MRGKWGGIAEEIRRKVETWSCCERWKFPRINLQKRLQHLHFFPRKIFSQLLIFIGRQLGQIHRLKLDSSELWKLERNHPESGQFSVFNWWLAAPLLRSLRSANLLLQPPSLPQYQSHFSFHHPDNKEILHSNVLQADHMQSNFFSSCKKIVSVFRALIITIVVRRRVKWLLLSF